MVGGRTHVTAGTGNVTEKTQQTSHQPVYDENHRPCRAYAYLWELLMMLRALGCASSKWFNNGG